MDIITFLTAGVWVANRKITQYQDIIPSGEDIPLGELSYIFSPNYSLIINEKGLQKKGTYAIDLKDYLDGKGHPKVIIDINNRQYNWILTTSRFTLKTDSEGNLISGNMFLTRYDGDWSYALLFYLKK